MKLHRISFLAALVAVFVLTGCGSSGIGDILGGGSDSSTTGPYGQNVDNVRGTIERVNTTERYIVVDAEQVTSNLRNGDDGEVVLYYDDRTTVEHQGRTYQPADLEPGDRILADVNSNGSRLLAEEIEVLYDVTSNGSNDSYGNGTYDDSRTTELRGTIRSVDTRDQTLELEPSTGRSGIVVVHYDSGTSVEFEGRQYKPENLERGDRVEIEVRELNGRMVAQEILVVDDAASR
jgi:hypothetical protein